MWWNCAMLIKPIGGFQIRIRLKLWILDQRSTNKIQNQNQLNDQIFVMIKMSWIQSLKWNWFDWRFFHICLLLRIIPCGWTSKQRGWDSLHAMTVGSSAPLGMSWISWWGDFFFGDRLMLVNCPHPRVDGALPNFHEEDWKTDDTALVCRRRFHRLRWLNDYTCLKGTSLIREGCG